jgi:hypothetical protein
MALEAARLAADAVIRLEEGDGDGWVAVAVIAVASGVTSGSGGVAVAGDCWRWQCGHFEW